MGVWDRGHPPRYPASVTLSCVNLGRLERRVLDPGARHGGKTGSAVLPNSQAFLSSLEAATAVGDMGVPWRSASGQLAHVHPVPDLVPCPC